MWQDEFLWVNYPTVFKYLLQYFLWGERSATNSADQKWKPRARASVIRPFPSETETPHISYRESLLYPF